LFNNINKKTVIPQSVINTIWACPEKGRALHSQSFTPNAGVKGFPLRIPHAAVKSIWNPVPK